MQALKPLLAGVWRKAKDSWSEFVRLPGGRKAMSNVRPTVSRKRMIVTIIVVVAILLIAVGAVGGIFTTLLPSSLATWLAVVGLLLLIGLLGWSFIRG